jgi:uncharacterized membrane protein YuzA (DUF378 family)
MAASALAFITDPTIVVLIGAVFAVLNGLFKLTLLGKMPLFYTATILLLYTANDLTSGSENVLTRVFYNVVGITIGPDFRRSQAHKGLIDCFRPGQDGGRWSRVRNRVGTRHGACRWT